MSIIALDWYYLDCSVTTDAHFGRASPLSFFSPLFSFFYFSRILENRMRGERGGGATAPLSPVGEATGPPAPRPPLETCSKKITERSLSPVAWATGGHTPWATGAHFRNFLKWPRIFEILIFLNIKKKKTHEK